MQYLAYCMIEITVQENVAVFTKKYVCIELTFNKPRLHFISVLIWRNEEHPSHD